MEELIRCPVCGNADQWNRHFRRIKDHALSGETFEISNCEDCGLLATDPRPSEEEIGCYYDFATYVSHKDDAPGFINRLYQAARHYTTRKKLSLINKEKRTQSQESKLLDYGCGTGFFLQAAVKSGWTGCGVEVSKVARDIAADRVNGSVYASLSDVPIGESFDAITLWHVLEHIHKLNETFATLLTLLKPEGVMIVAVPNPEAADAKHYQQWWAAYDVPRHLYHFPARTVNRLVKDHGATVTKQIGQPLDAFYIGLLSEKYRRGSAVSGLLNGLRSYIKAWESGNHSSIIYVIRKNT